MIGASISFHWMSQRYPSQVPCKNRAWAMPEAEINILLIEDDGSHVELMERACSQAGTPCRITRVGTLTEARERLLKFTPDVVIADLRLPDGLGTEILGADPESAPYPVIVLTGQGNQTTAVEALKAGAIEYVVKSAETLASIPQVAERTVREWRHIAERRRAEESLRRQEALLRAVTSATPLALYVVDHRTDRVLFYNRRFLTIWNLERKAEGITRGEFTHRQVFQECLPLVRDASMFLAALAPLEDDTNRAMLEEEVDLIDGRTLRWFSAPVYHDPGDCVGRLYQFEDITERKRAEATAHERAAAAERMELLSPREREVLELVVAGLANKVIAARLNISIKTVEMHRAQVMRKLRVDNVAELVRLAVAAGTGQGKP